MENHDPMTFAIIGAAMEVHNQLGQGFLEAVYQDALEIEFSARDIPYRREAPIDVEYKGKLLPARYRADFLCFDNVIIETKAVAKITAVEQAQILNYLKATNIRKGLLINFGEHRLRYKRFLN